MKHRLPFIDNKDLYVAVMSCIRSIDEGYPKASSIKSAALWRGVKQTEVLKLIEAYYPKSFFYNRKKIPIDATLNQNKRAQAILDSEASKHMSSI